MTEHVGLPYLNEIVLFLLLAGLLIPLLARLRVNPVLGFLLLGTLVGPYGLGSLVSDYSWLRYLSFSRPEGVAALSEFGVVFLMFILGLELSLERLRLMRRWVFGAGSAQLLVSALLIGSIAFAFGNNVEAALVLGAAMAFSSTAVVMQLLGQRRALGTPLGRGAFSILLLQDMAVVPLLILVGVLSTGSEGNLWFLLVSAIAKGVLVVALILLIGRRLLRPVFHQVCVGHGADTFIALTLLCILGIAALTWAVGLSVAMGAFLAGLLLAETEYRHEVQVSIEPFKGLLMGLFFMSVGMSIDLRALAEGGIWLPLSILGLYTMKALIIVLVFRIFGLPWSCAVEGGLLLGQSGEFAFIVIGTAQVTGLLEPTVAQFMLLVVGPTLLLTPILARLGHQLGKRLEQRQPAVIAGSSLEVLPPMAGHVVVAGCGRVGLLIVDLLAKQRLEYVALEKSAKRVAQLHSKGLNLYTGDAAHQELLRRVQVAEAASVVLTMDDVDSAVHAVKAIRRISPRVRIIARARDEQHAQALRQSGANLVIPETLETGLQMAADILDVFGVTREAVLQLIERERERRVETV